MNVSSEVSDVCKCVAIPLQAWTVCMRLRPPEYLGLSTHGGGKFVGPNAPATFTTREILLVLVSVGG